MKKLHLLETLIATLLIMLALGLAIAVHPVFLVLGFLATIAVIIETVVHAMGRHVAH